jgi:predicted DNA-binding transcriptional regulator AlpA
MPERLLSVTETLRRVAYKDKGSLLRLAKDGHFPMPVRLNPHAANSAIAWRESDIDEWIRTRPYGMGKALPREAYSRNGRPRKVKGQDTVVQLVTAPAAAPVARIKLIKRA